jgi:hypothetical protein
MRKSILIIGLIILVAGVALVVFGFQYASSSEALIEAREWNVTWYSILDSSGRGGDVLGFSTLPRNFRSESISYGDWLDHFGFKAKLHITLRKDTTVIFKAEGDDGVMLFVDGSPVINTWTEGRSVWGECRLFLNAGSHELELWYYEWEGYQEVDFEMHTEEFETATIMQTVAGVTVLVIGAIITVIGFILKPKVKA